MTYRLSCKSVLFPTRQMITSFPRSARTSSSHCVVFWNDCLLVISYTMMATEESRMYPGMSDRKRSCIQNGDNGVRRLNSAFQREKGQLNTQWRIKHVCRTWPAVSQSWKKRLEIDQCAMLTRMGKGMTYMESNGFVVQMHGFAQKVDSNGGLRGQILRLDTKNGKAAILRTSTLAAWVDRVLNRFH